MKQEIKIVLEQFEKHNNSIIINKTNFELFNTLPKIKCVNRLHIEFKCDKCNNISDRRADTFFKWLCPPKVLLNGATYPGITEKCKFML